VTALVRASAPSGEELARITLVPVEVFGADEEDCRDCGGTIKFGYGLMDAVPAWSDCNRAIGRVYRVEDMEGRNTDGAAECITVYVPKSELPKFEKRHGDGTSCPSCHVPYGELPEGHQVSHPVCTGSSVVQAAGT
jgi:hypothetical protein